MCSAIARLPCLLLIVIVTCRDYIRRLFRNILRPLYDKIVPIIALIRAKGYRCESILYHEENSMLITNISITNFKKFTTSRITNLDIKIDKPIQIIVGTNGSGKSSLLTELTPYPTVKSSYNRNGVKSLIMMKDGDTYESLFTKSDGHSFLVNGRNINANNSYTIQKEMIETHLGLTPAKMTILQCGYTLSDMKVSQRKSLMFTLNPIDISLLERTAKLVRKTDSSLQFMIGQFSGRLSELLSSKLSDDDYTSLTTLKSTLENMEKLLFSWSIEIHTKLDGSCVEPTVNIDTVVSRIHDVYERGLRDFVVPSDEIDMYLGTLEAKRSSLLDTTKQVEVSIDEAISEINTLNTDIANIERLSPDTDTEIASLKKDIAKYERLRDFVPIPVQYTDAIEKSIPILTSLITDLDGECTADIMSDSDISILKDNIATSTQERVELNNKLIALDADLRNTTSSVIEYSVANDCSKNTCQLYNTYTDRVNSSKNRLSSIQNEIATLRAKRDKVDSSLRDMTDRLNVQRAIWKCISAIQKTIDSIPYLSSVVSTSNMMDTFSITPFAIITTIEQRIHDSREYRRYVEITDRLDILFRDKKTKDRLDDINIKHLIQRRDTLDTTLATLRKKKDSLQREIDTNTVTVDSTRAFSKVLKELRDIETYLERSLVEMTNSKRNEYLSKLHRIVCSRLDAVRSELVVVIRQVDKQRSIVDRITTEVSPPLKDAKIKKKRSHLVKTALTEIQVVYTKAFLNNIVKSMNCFMAMLFSYPVEIPPVEVVDFKFPVLINDETLIPDISECSTGQKCLIDLAFNMALVLELKLNEYPLFVDELDSALDAVHKRNLIDFFVMLIDRKIVSQLFIVNHNVEFHSSLNGDYIVLDDTNIHAVASNDNVSIVKK